MPKWNGGVIGVANNPTQSSAKGIWSLSEATKAIRAGLWPPSNAGADPYFENVTLLLPGDGTNGAQNNTFLDSSTNNFTITRNGNTTQGTFTPFSKADGRWSNYFNGSSDFLNIGSGYPASLDLGSSNFTIEGWVYLQASTKQLLLGNLNNSSGTCTFFVILNNTSASARYEIKFGSSSFNLGTGTLPTNQWVHVCVMRSGTSIFLFENGAQVGTTQTLSGSITSSTNQMRVGGAIAGEYPLSGYASNLRMVIGSAVYSTSGFTVPTAFLTAITNTALLTCQSNRFVDSSTNAIAVTTSGTPSVQTFSPFPTLTAYAAGTNGGSGYFDGTGDYLTIANSAALSYGTGSFTIEGFFNTSAAGQYAALFSDESSGGTSGLTLLMNPTAGNGQLALYGNGGLLITATGKYNDNAWHHFAISRDSTNLRLYVDGAYIGASSSGSTNFDASSSLYLMSSVIAGRTNSGYLSSFRTLKGTALYTGTSSITVPTAPLTAITNTSLLLNFTNGGIIDTSMSNDLETVGNAQISTTQSKFGGASMYFDGTGDYLVSPKTPNLVLGDTWTIECWYRPESRTDTYPTIVSVSPGNQNGTIAIFDRHQSYSSTFSFSVGSGAQVNCSTTVSNGTWYHLALVSNAGSVILYVNGTADNTAASRTTSDNTNRQVYVGCNFDFATYSTEINGYVDDLRITRGIARYTANFTAPTGPFIGFGD